MCDAMVWKEILTVKNNGSWLMVWEAVCGEEGVLDVQENW